MPDRRSAVIFDCDGVMFDSQQANTHFYNHLLAHFQLPPMTAHQELFVHMHTAADSVDYIFRGSPHAGAAQRYRLQLDYTPFIQSMVLDPELLPLLRQLRPHFGLAVATNRSNTIGTVLQRHGLEGFFDIVVSCLDVTRPKPDPEGLHKILDFFALPPGRAFYVGDSELDAQTARAAGVPFIACRNPQLEARHHVVGLLEIASIAKRALGGNNE